MRNQIPHNRILKIYEKTVPSMRYNGEELFIDSKEPDFEKYHDFLNGEVRYNSLVLKNPDLAKELLEANKEYAKNRYKYYKNLLDNQKKED